MTLTDAKRMAEIRKTYGELSTFDYECHMPIEATIVDLLARIDELEARLAKAVEVVEAGRAWKTMNCRDVKAIYLNNQKIWDAVEAYDAHVAAEGKAAESGGE